MQRSQSQIYDFFHLSIDVRDEAKAEFRSKDVAVPRGAVCPAIASNAEQFTERISLLSHHCGFPR
jgi:hypothetical protein